MLDDIFPAKIYAFNNNMVRRAVNFECFYTIAFDGNTSVGFAHYNDGGTGQQRDEVFCVFR